MPTVKIERHWAQGWIAEDRTFESIEDALAVLFESDRIRNRMDAWDYRIVTIEVTSHDIVEEFDRRNVRTE